MTVAPRRGLSTEVVVELAADLADRSGIDGLTLAAVAAEAGVRTPSLYNHIDGLDGLRDAVRQRGLELLGSALVDAAVGRARDDAVRAMADAYRSFALAHPGLYDAVQRPGTDASNAHADHIARTVAVVMEGYGLEGEEALHAVRGLRSLLHGFVSLELVGGFKMGLDLEASLDWLLSAFLAGVQSSVHAGR